MAGAEPVVQHFDGAAWTAIPTPVSFGFIDAALWANSPTDVWLSGSTASGVLHWDGTAFTPVPSGGSPVGGNIWSNGPNNVWTAGGQQRRALGRRGVDDSATNVAGFPSWQAIWQTPDGKVRVFGDGGAILRK